MNLHWHRKNASFEDVKDYHGDLILLNAFAGAEEIVQILNENHVFDEARVMEKNPKYAYVAPSAGVASTLIVCQASGLMVYFLGSVPDIILLSEKVQLIFSSFLISLLTVKVMV